MDNERFVPQAKRPKTVQKNSHENNLELYKALDTYRPRRTTSVASSETQSVGTASTSSWENIGGRVEGTNNVLLNWGGPSKANTSPGKPAVLAELDEFPLDGDAVPEDPTGTEDDTPSSAQNVIRRNIDAFLRMQMNRYVLDHRDLLDLSHRDVEQVQKNIINYWLNRHLRIERDPLYNFAELVSGALDEKVEFLLKNARNFRVNYEGAQRRETFRGELAGEDDPNKEDKFVDEQQSLLKKNTIVREALTKYAKEEIEGRNASINADVFMMMLQDFEISGHIEVTPVLTNAWKAVHRIVLREAYPPRVTEPTFFGLIKNENVRAAYARATALQMMLYRQLDKRRSYLAVDYDRVKENLHEALRDIVETLRETHLEIRPKYETLMESIAAASNRPTTELTTIAGEMKPRTTHFVENMLARIRLKKGTKCNLTLEEMLVHETVVHPFGRLVGIHMRLMLDAGKRMHVAAEAQQREGELNVVWTELLTALKQVGLLTIPTAWKRYGMICETFA